MKTLPKVKIGNKIYFVDERLNELRNVKNIHDREKMEGSKRFYVSNFGVNSDDEICYHENISRHTDCERCIDCGEITE